MKMNLKIIKKLVKNFGERNGWKPDLIVVHISGGTDTSMLDWFSKPTSQASSHYGVDLQSGDIYQYVEEDKKAWTQGNVNNPSSEIVKSRVGVNPNLYCISIENEGTDLSKGSEIQFNSLCELIKDIATRHNIPLDRQHILGHFEIDTVNRPYCPSKDHSIMDKIVNKLNEKDEEMVLVPKKLIEELSRYK